MRRSLPGLLGAFLVFPFGMLPVLAAQDTATPPAVASPSPTAGTSLFLLEEDQVPEGLVTIQDGERTLEDVASGFSDPEAAMEQFVEWGWRRNVVRAFHVPENADADPNQIDGIYMSVHEFDSPASAAAALDYAFDVHAEGSGLKEMPDPRMGDYSRGLYGRLSYGNEVTLYVQQGNVLIRLSAASPQGDPRAATKELMEIVLASQPATPDQP